MKRRRFAIFQILIFAFCSISLLKASAQKKTAQDNFYVFNASWKPTTADKAVFFIVVSPADSGFEWDFYNDHGPLVRIETHSTHDGGDLNGPVYFYTASGDLDSTATYLHGKKDGYFYKYGLASNNRRFCQTEYLYRQDSLIEVKDKIAEEEELLRKDSVNKLRIGHDSVEKPSETSIRENIQGHASGGTLELESSFPGGLKAWQRFLQHNLSYPEEAVNRRLSGNIIIRFAVDTTGKTGNYSIFHSANFWLDREALRVLKKSGNWEPAYKDGKPVKSYKQQPISMRLQ